MSDLILPQRTQMIQVCPSSKEVIASNLQQLKEIEAYQIQNPKMSMEQAAIEWIDSNAASWRNHNPLEV